MQRTFLGRQTAKLAAFSILVVTSLLSFSVLAQEEQKVTYAYVALEPDIVTNYASVNSKKLGYLRLTIELMLTDPSLIPHVEHHMPRLRAKVIELIGAQSEQQVRSLSGREEIRRTLLTNFKDIFVMEVGKEVVDDIIFTKYLRQGG